MLSVEFYCCFMKADGRMDGEHSDVSKHVSCSLFVFVFSLMYLTVVVANSWISLCFVKLLIKLILSCNGDNTPTKIVLDYSTMCQRQLEAFTLIFLLKSLSLSPLYSGYSEQVVHWWDNQ